MDVTIPMLPYVPVALDSATNLLELAVPDVSSSTGYTSISAKIDDILAFVPPPTPPIVGLNQIAYGDNTTGAITSVSTFKRDPISGYIGIGLTTPTAKLHVEGSDDLSTSPLVKLTGASGTNGMFMYDNGKTTWYVGGAIAMGLDNGSNFTSYNYSYFKDAVTLGNLTQVPTTLYMQNTWHAGFGALNSGSMVNIDGQNFTNALSITNASTALLTQLSSGNFGVGNSTPSDLGSFYHTKTATSMGSTIDAINLGGHYSNSAGNNLKIKMYDDGGSQAGFGVSSGQFDYKAYSNFMGHAFYNGSVLTMMVGGGGYEYVGIGTGVPLSKLDINGPNGYTQFRLRQTYTPSSTADANGNNGDFAFDATYLYLKTSGAWGRLALDFGF